MTGRNQQPTTRQRWTRVCPRVPGILLLAALLASSIVLLNRSAGAQEASPVRSGSAEVAGGSVGESGAAALPEPDGKKNGVDPVPAPEAPVAPETPIPPPSDPAAPPFHVSEVKVDGLVTGDRADLTVRITVEVNRPGAWFDVPLRLSQAHIYGEQSSGVGSRMPGQPTLQDDGLHWQFFGQGKHTLEFKLGVPVRSTPSGRQVQLSLPVMPPLFEAQFQLRLAGGDFAVRSANRDASLRTEFDASKNETVVTGGSPGGRLELAWQDRRQRPPADGVASTTYTLRRRTPGWELDAHQILIRMESPSNELLVRVPEGFEVSELTGPLLDDWNPVEDRPGWVRASFIEGPSDRIELRWRLERSSGPSDAVLSLSGFEIEGVRTHDGRIRVLPVPGMQVFPRQSSMQYVERIEDVPPPAEPPSLMTYAFSASDWQLVLELKTIDPLFACRPRIDLHLREEIATLVATFEITEEAGEVTRMLADVQALEAAGWTPSNGPRPGASTATVSRNGSQVAFEWNGSSSGRKLAELRYERPLSGAEFSFLVPPPIPVATWTEPVTIAVRAADPLRVEVSGGAAVSDPQLESVPSSENSRLIGIYQSAVDAEPLSVHASVEARTISATTNVLVESIETRRITIEQQIMLDVRYGRMDALRLEIPADFPVTPGAERLAFQVWVDGREATGLEWTSGAIRVPFPRPRIGLIRVSIRYALPRDENHPAVRLPVILTPDVKYHDVTMEAAPAVRVAVDQEDRNWKEIVTSSDRRRWSADPQADSVSLQFETSQSIAGERAVISAAFLRTELAPGGIQQTVATYLIERAGETLSFSLPAAATVRTIVLNSRPAQTVRTTGHPADRFITIRMPPEAGASTTRVEISYEVVPAVSQRAIDRIQVQFPQFAAGTFIDQMIWKLELPETDVLFDSPPGMTQLFHWQRRGVLWRRVLSPAYLAVLQHAGFQLSDADAGEEGYAFRQIGGPANLEVWIIDRSLVILIGAGVTLILGFAFWTIRRLQNVLVLLFLAFLISLAGLWFPEAIQVLLQPALIGIAMAMIATAVDGRTRRRRYRAPGRESSIQQTPRTPSPRASDPLRSTILRPTGSDQGAPR